MLSEDALVLGMVLSTVRAGLLISTHAISKLPLSHAQKFVAMVIPNPIQLAITINDHMYFTLFSKSLCQGSCWRQTLVHGHV